MIHNHRDDYWEGMGLGYNKNLLRIQRKKKKTKQQQRNNIEINIYYIRWREERKNNMITCVVYMLLQSKRKRINWTRSLTFCAYRWVAKYQLDEGDDDDHGDDGKQRAHILFNGKMAWKQQSYTHAEHTCWKTHKEMSISHILFT